MFHLIGRPGYAAGFVVLAAVTVFTSSAEASSVVPMTLTTLSDHAGQVIVGEVTQRRPYWADNPKRIETEVTFQNVEYLKGALPGSSSVFKLVVPGGKVGEMQMRICCAPTFAQGEKWVLFLLPTYKTFPVAGLHQGAWRIYRDADGQERVGNAFHIPVDGVDADGFVRAAGKRAWSPHSQHLLAEHNVRVQEVAQRSGEPAEGMTYQSFLDTIRPLLDRSKDHHLTEQAGRRVLVEPTAVPLQPSAMQNTEDSVRSEDTGKSPSSGQRGTGQARGLEEDARIAPSPEHGKEVR
ncbi:MAG: hypothetical protein ABII12_10680 [Planctomycetota bacterium]